MGLLGGRISANPPVSCFRGAAGGAQEEGHVLDTPPAWDITRREGGALRRFFCKWSSSVLHKSCIFRSLFSFFMIKKDRNIAHFLYRCFIGKCSEMYETFWSSLWLGYIIRIKLHIKQAPCCLFCSLLGLSCEIKDNQLKTIETRQIV